ncbi:MAG TPA: hypothetical protein VK190_04685 [Pseudoneobacillus sp.]|nr:hypothetical protein [Pseudoneobacillus sp.]
MKPELCVLIGATEEQKREYLRLVSKFTSARLANTWPDCLDGLRYDDYVVVEPPKESVNSTVRLAKQFGAEVIGIFFNSQPKSTVGFDRVIIN